MTDITRNIRRIGMRRALVILLLVVLIPMLLVQGGIYYKWFQTRRAEELRANRQVAEATGAAFLEFVRDVRNQEVSIGRALISLKTGGPRDIAKYLTAAAKEDPTLQYLAWTTPQGRIIAASDARSPDTDISSRPFFQAILKGDDWSISDLAPSRLDGKPTFLVVQAIHGANRVRQGTVVGEIEMNGLDVLSLVAPAHQGMIVILDHHGRPVYSQPPAPAATRRDPWLISDAGAIRSALAGQESGGTFVWPTDGRQWIAAWTPLGRTGWAVGSNQPMSLALVPVYRSLEEALGLTTIVIAASILVAVLFSRRITGPLGHLRDYALALGRDEPGRCEHAVWITELRDLGEAFNRMADQLQERKAALQKANEELELRVRERTAELTRSNADLERFAYVSSHDLQEPLRMVASYVGLLEMRYKDKLDDDARTFIAYAVEGAVRMQRLIRDLLEYSQVGRGMTRLPTPVDTEAILREALANLKVRIRETNARITHDPLPTILGEETQVLQLLQNLIENALKFCHPDRLPAVHVSAERHDQEWIFTVRDNGIGIEAQYFEKIFVIFQRLHTRRHYAGNGIGLAICKRIVERSGGRIWVEAVPGEGSTFYFTLPGAAGPGQKEVSSSPSIASSQVE